MSEEKGHTVRRTRYLVATGSFEEGFQFYGPFRNQYKAQEWAGDNLIGIDWVLAPLREVSDA